jgi:hypothetical protein
LFSISKYYLVLESIVKVLSGINKHPQVSPRIVRYFQKLSQLTAKRNIIQFICFINFFYKISYDIVKFCQVYAKHFLFLYRYCQVLPSISNYHQVLPSITKYCQVSLSINIVQYVCRMKQVFVKYCWYC